MRRSGLVILSAVVALGATGCASLVQPADPLSPLALALAEPVASIEARAGRGEKEALFALAFLTDYGLRGVARDQVRAVDLRLSAARPTSTMITQYIPAIGGGAGRTSVIPISIPGMNEGQMALLDLCGLALVVGAEETGREICSPDGWDRLAPLGRQAVAESAASTPLP